MFHAPRVYALGAGYEVEIEEGDEALYPRAARWAVIPRRTDDEHRVERPALQGVRAMFVPMPHVRQAGVPARVDVVVAPRRRAYGAQKNWPHWPRVVAELQAAGLTVFAGGVAEASDTRVPCPAAWEAARPLDATLAAMHGATVVLAACSGLAPLALMCGRPLLLFTYRGRVAPGPVIDSHGRRAYAQYWPVRVAEYYDPMNHRGAPFRMVDAWEDPAKVVAETVRWVAWIRGRNAV
jgi:hypothetical protein